MESLKELIANPLRIFPRLCSWIVISICLLLAILVFAPHQFPVVVFKLALASLGAIVGYHVDRSTFPYARPDSYLRDDWRNGKVPPTGTVNLADYPVIAEYRWVFIGCMIRRGLIMAAVILALALGL